MGSIRDKAKEWQTNMIIHKVNSSFNQAMHGSNKNPPASHLGAGISFSGPLTIDLLTASIASAVHVQRINSPRALVVATNFNYFY